MRVAVDLVDAERHASNQDLIKMGADVTHRAPSLTAALSGRARTRGHHHSPTAVTHRLVDAGVRREEVRDVERDRRQLPVLVVRCHDFAVPLTTTPFR